MGFRSCCKADLFRLWENVKIVHLETINKSALDGGRPRYGRPLRLRTAKNLPPGELIDIGLLGFVNEIVRKRKDSR